MISEAIRDVKRMLSFAMISAAVACTGTSIGAKSDQRSDAMLEPNVAVRVDACSTTSFNLPRQSQYRFRVWSPDNITVDTMLTVADSERDVCVEYAEPHDDAAFDAVSCAAEKLEEADVSLHVASPDCELGRALVKVALIDPYCADNDCIVSEEAPPELAELIDATKSNQRAFIELNGSRYPKFHQDGNGVFLMEMIEHPGHRSVATAEASARALHRKYASADGEYEAFRSNYIRLFGTSELSDGKRRVYIGVLYVGISRDDHVIAVLINELGRAIHGAIFRADQAWHRLSEPQISLIHAGKL